MADEVKPPTKAQRVLVVEDDALIGMLYADLLKEMGHTVCAIETTEAEAVAAARLYKPDLMIVDAGLGKGSGVSAVNEILRTGFIPHVFISGDTASVGKKAGRYRHGKTLSGPGLGASYSASTRRTLNR